jgi:alanine-glyoxylate transaminase/serine-glyoxylate transaminase/serine-pyruvate transaminase
MATALKGFERFRKDLAREGDRLVVCAAGFFGQRLAELAGRMGAEVVTVEKEWGEVFTPDEVDAAVARAKPTAVAFVHAETSTGALQPMEGLGDVAHRHDALLIVDCVTSLGGAPVLVDEWGMDAAYSASQKCLGCPPGMAPVTLGPRARQAMAGRSLPAHGWYLDLELLERYWGGDRAYHHTISSTLVYALREALRMVVEEGLEARWDRHRANAEMLWLASGAGPRPARPGPRAPHPVTTAVRVPEGTKRQCAGTCATSAGSRSRPAQPLKEGSGGSASWATARRRPTSSSAGPRDLLKRP